MVEPNARRGLRDSRRWRQALDDNGWRPPRLGCQLVDLRFSGVVWAYRVGSVACAPVTVAGEMSVTAPLVPPHPPTAPRTRSSSLPRGSQQRHVPRRSPTPAGSDPIARRPVSCRHRSPGHRILRPERRPAAAEVESTSASLVAPLPFRLRLDGCGGPRWPTRCRGAFSVSRQVLRLGFCRTCASGRLPGRSTSPA